MPHLKMFAVAFAIAAWLPTGAAAAEDPVSPATDAAESAEAPPPKCLKASVNPVTGHAICIEPKGAPVDPPPRSALQRPCPPRAHDDDPFTIYEHWSGCH